MPFWAYMLHCNGGRLYAGHTDDLERRIAQHRTGQIEGFTKRFAPVELVWAQEFVTRDEAKAAELQIKGWSRAKKLALIRGDWSAISRLAKTKDSPSTSSGQSVRDKSANPQHPDVRIAQTAVAAMHAHAAAAHPHEACGILLGTGTRITEAQAAYNVHPAPHTHFEIDPQALIAAHRAAREGGLEVVGYYHSHPSGTPAPSATDRAMAAHDGRIWAIIAGRQVRFWQDAPQGFEALSYTIDES